MTYEQLCMACAEQLGWTWQAWGKNHVQVFAPDGSKPNWSGEDKETNSMKWPLQGQTVDEAGRSLICRAGPDPLHSIADAFALVESARKDGWEFDVHGTDSIGSGSGWMAQFGKWEHGLSSIRIAPVISHRVTDPDLCRAITIAFLKLREKA